jgi:hypothetical protein
MVSAPFAETLEGVLTTMPSLVMMAKLIEPGIEATMMSISATLFNLNKLTLKQMIGVFLNETFVHVKNNQLDRYYILTTIGLFGTFLPILLIKLLVPTN